MIVMNGERNACTAGVCQSKRKRGGGDKNGEKRVKCRFKPDVFGF